MSTVAGPAGINVVVVVVVAIVVVVGTVWQ
jgi:hypothetical protein